MTSALAPCRSALVVLALLLGALVLPLATAQAAAPDDTADEATEVFTGRVQAVEQIPGATNPERVRLRLTVQVILVFGETTVDTDEVIVHTTADSCATYPQGQETKRYLFRLTRQTNGLIADKCSDVADLSLFSQDQLDTYGDSRSPISSGGTPTAPVPLDDPTYTCPDTHEAIPTFDTDTAAERAGCDALDDPSSADRAAAPGLALAIVGLLGLVVIARLGRRRRR